MIKDITYDLFVEPGRNPGEIVVIRNATRIPVEMEYIGTLQEGDIITPFFPGRTPLEYIVYIVNKRGKSHHPKYPNVPATKKIMTMSQLHLSEVHSSHEDI